MEKHDAEHDRSHSPDTRPHGIGGTDGQRMHGLCKQQHADDHTGEKARSPQIPLRTRSLFHLTQTECETRLKKSGACRIWVFSFGGLLRTVVGVGLFEYLRGRMDGDGWRKMF